MWECLFRKVCLSPSALSPPGGNEEQLPGVSPGPGHHLSSRAGGWDCELLCKYSPFILRLGAAAAQPRLDYAQSKHSIDHRVLFRFRKSVFGSIHIEIVETQDFPPATTKLSGPKYLLFFSRFSSCAPTTNSIGHPSFLGLGEDSISAGQLS